MGLLDTTCIDMWDSPTTELMPMNYKLFILAGLIAAILLVGVVRGDSIPGAICIGTGVENCDFETGDFTDWITLGGGYESVTEAAAYGGVYGADLHPADLSGSGYQMYTAAMLSTAFDANDIDGGLSFHYKVNRSGGTSGAQQLQIGISFNIGVDEYYYLLVDETAPAEGDWITYYISKEDLIAALPPGGTLSPTSRLSFLALTYRDDGVTTGYIDVWVDNIEVPLVDEPAPAAGSTLVLELIALCLLFLLASIWSEENVRFGYVLVPLAAAFFVWAGFLPFAYLTTIIPLMIFMGIFSFMRMQAKYKWGFAGTSGGILYKIVFFLIMIQMVIGYVNGMNMFATNSVITPDNQYTGYTLTSAQSVYGANSYGIDVVDVITNGLQMIWTSFKVLWSMLAAVFLIYPTLVTQFHVPADLSLLIQCGIYIIYGLELFNMVFKPFKAAEV
jgi:hypothetical protein